MNSNNAMFLHLSEHTNEPLHAQISRQIRSRILAGELADGDPIASIRKMAREQRVSVITVQRAYDDLEKEGLLRSRPGKGFYVAGLTDETKKEMSVSRLKELLEPVLTDSVEAGMDTGEILEVVQGLLKGKGGTK